MSLSKSTTMFHHSAHLINATRDANHRSMIHLPPYQPTTFNFSSTHHSTSNQPDQPQDENDSFAMCTYTLTIYQCPRCFHVHDTTSPSTPLQPCNTSDSCLTATPSSERRFNVPCSPCLMSSRSQLLTEQRGVACQKKVDDRGRNEEERCAEEGGLIRGKKRRSVEIREWWLACSRQWETRWGAKRKINK
jgi:hypothetical protein